MYNCMLYRSLYDYTSKKSQDSKDNLQFEEKYRLAMQALYKKEENKKTLYLEKLFLQQAELLVRLVGEFETFSKEKNFSPILLMMPSFLHVVHQNKGNVFYRAALKEIEQRYTDVLVIDMYTHLKEFSEEELESFYVNKIGHHSAKANRFISNVLYEQI